MIPISSVLLVLSLSLENNSIRVNVMYIFCYSSLNFISLRNLSFRETLERFINLCTQKNLGEKKRKKSNAQQHPYLKKKRRKKVREKSDVYFFSLSFLFRERNARARDCSGLSLFCASAFLLFSHRNNDAKKELRELYFKVKDKKIYCGARDVVRSQRCPFVHQKSLKHRKATVLFRKNLS